MSIETLGYTRCPKPYAFVVAGSPRMNQAQIRPGSDESVIAARFACERPPGAQFRAHSTERFSPWRKYRSLLSAYLDGYDLPLIARSWADESQVV